MLVRSLSLPKMKEKERMKRPLLVTVGLALGGMAGASLADGNMARAAEGGSLTPTTSEGGGAATATAPDKTPSTADSKAHGAGAGLGLTPNTPQLPGGTSLRTKEAESLTATTTSASADEWKCDFHGYMRAPLRVLLGFVLLLLLLVFVGLGCLLVLVCFFCFAG